MIRTSLLVLICLVAIHTAMADTYPIILTGTVTMEDGSPPPFIVSIQRSCSDFQSDTPGPLTNKKGEWIWRLEIDPFSVRYCVFQAMHPGYKSSTIDASNLNLNSRDTTLKLPPLILRGASIDPYSIRTSGDSMPGRAKGPFEKAMKALDAHKFDEAVSLLQTVTAGSPKFAEGWHALGIVEEKTGKPAEARDAYTHAIDADPKGFPYYVTLARLCIKTKDWQCTLQTADKLIKEDPKNTYSEIYLHKAVAQYELKDLPGAEQSAEEAIRLDPKYTKPREEYVLGRILEAKGDLKAAREHMSKYLELEATAPDAEIVQGHMLGLGKPENAGVEPVLEPL
jgi:tetratricopeptide (TPR) repeat protein